MIRANFPTDIEIAKNRLERRKDFLTKYYGITTSTDLARQVVLSPISLAAMPLFVADEYRVHVFGGDGNHEEEKSKEELKQKIELINAEAKKKEKILADFIEADMKQEYMSQQINTPNRQETAPASR